jgi:hypothetical protein
MFFWPFFYLAEQQFGLPKKKLIMQFLKKSYYFLAEATRSN